MGNVTAAVTETAVGSSLTRLWPMTAPVKGVNYEPTLSDYTIPPSAIYFDTDFYNRTSCSSGGGLGHRPSSRTAATTWGTC